MDTNPYSNILKAVGGEPTQTKPDNWAIINKWISEGRDLAEIDRQMSEGKPSMDRELFHAMEQSVRNDPDVKKARQHAADVKTEIITEFCLRDPRYKEALESYQKAVSEAYLRRDKGEY